jgi:cytochrome P450
VPKWRLLERLERFVGGRLRTELQARGIAAEPDAAKIGEAKQLAAAVASLPAESQMSAFVPQIQAFLASFRADEAAAPPDLAELAAFVTQHEAALLAFFETEARGGPDTSCVEAFLTQHGAPQEAPIPEGLALTPIDEAFRADPASVFHRLRARAPVHRDRGMASRVVLTRHDDVMRVVRDLSLWSDPRKSLPDDPIRMFLAPDPDAEPSMLLLDDPEHRRLRNLVSRSFTPRAVEKARPQVRQVARRLVDQIEAAGPGEFDLMEALASPLPAIAIAELLGVDTAMQARFKQWSVAASDAFFSPFGGEELKRAGLAAGEALRAFFEDEIEKRRRHPSHDLIGRMVEAEREGDKLTQDEIVSLCNLLLIAGNVTTTDLIGNGVRALIEHPEELAKLRERPERIENAVEEMLRFDPPVQTTGRIASRDMEIDGIPIRKGESITLHLAAANRDPAVYPDPDRFDIEREDTHHQSFGGGTHLCLGAHLARLEAQEAIGALIGRLPELRATGRSTYKQIPGFRGMSEYGLRWG